MLRLLQANGRLSNAELAKKAGVSAATCHRRTQRLFEEGLIAEVRAMVDPRKVDRGALVMVGVVLDRSTPESFAQFERRRWRSSGSCSTATWWPGTSTTS
jgi:Lrp/AsnC family transcriptional regulator, leucine-responsive regulatory protein